MVTKQFIEVATDYTDDNGVLYLDGYTTNEDDGCVIGYIFNKEVYYTNPEYRYLDIVISTVEDLRREGLVN